MKKTKILLFFLIFCGFLIYGFFFYNKKEDIIININSDKTSHKIIKKRTTQAINSYEFNNKIYTLSGLTMDNLKFYSKKTSSGIILTSSRLFLNYMYNKKFENFKDVSDSLDDIENFLEENQIITGNNVILGIISGYRLEMNSSLLCDLYFKEKSISNEIKYFRLFEKDCKYLNIGSSDL